ncbi:MAG: hypothetical protein A4E28_00024 [Methanocella sp. PtaU1.Bin125]|nr:MAG: hypothetical protein A4E28_00024 [Methanocella sp. PtaU1.Bin125]
MTTVPICATKIFPTEKMDLRAPAEVKEEFNNLSDQLDKTRGDTLKQLLDEHYLLIKIKNKFPDIMRQINV